MASTVRIDGLPVAAGTAVAFGRLKAAFERRFPGITLHVYSGYRSDADQARIFVERYRPQVSGVGPYGDVRWWNGVRYVRYSGEGTVAQPGTSNHRTGHAIDIRDSGSDAGVTIAGNARSNWIRTNAYVYGFNPAGYGFREPWHIEYIGDPWFSPGAPANVPESNESEEDDDMETELKGLVKAQDLGAPGKWWPILVSSATEHAFARGTERGTVNATVALSGGKPGSAVAQVRLVYNRMKDGKVVHSTKTLPVNSVYGTGASTAHISGAYEIGDDQEALIEVRALQPGVDVVQVQYSKLFKAD